MRSKIVLAIVALAVMTSSVGAATVIVSLNLDPSAPGCVGCTLSGPGTYNLVASIDSGDNFGIAAYSIPVLGVDTVLHRAPRANLIDDPDSGDSGTGGFTSFRTANNATVIPGGFLIGASLDVFTPTPFIIHGYGQFASSFVDQIPASASALGVLQGSWAADLVLAEGAYPVGTMPQIDFANVNIRASAFGDPTGTRLIPAQVMGGMVVEPPIVDDLDLGVAGLNATVGGMVTSMNADSFSGLLNPTYTPGACGPDGCNPNIAFAPQWDPLTQQFSWNTQGSARGTYTWDVEGSNAGGSDSGRISVEVPFVPEPATLALCGLALVGLAGIRGRK